MQGDGNEHQTGSDCESIVSGIISNDDERCIEADVGVKHKTIKQNDVQKHAKIDLENLDEIPDKINQILVTSTDSSRKLTTYNPMKIKLGIEQICNGPVTNTEYQRSGSILVTIKSKNQC